MRPRSSTRTGPGAAWVLALGVMDFSLEQTILIPALPAVVEEFDTDFTAVTWLVTSFLVASAVATRWPDGWVTATDVALFSWGRSRSSGSDRSCPRWAAPSAC